MENIGYYLILLDLSYSLLFSYIVLLSRKSTAIIVGVSFRSQLDAKTRHGGTGQDGAPQQTC